MNHRVKRLIFSGLSVLPRAAGDWLYHSLQRVSHEICSLEVIRRQREFYLESIKALTNLGADIEGKVFLELGSGWVPTIPLCCIYESNARRVLTYDINAHYDRNVIKRATLFYTLETGIQVDARQEHYFSLPDRVKYFPKTNILDTPPDEPVDIAISRFVLEHVRPEDLYEIHKDSRQWLRPGGRWYHLISPNDHRAYTDRSLSLYDFLRFSDQEWDRLQTRFDYHNRLRLPQYLEIFRDSGLEVELVKYEASARHLRQLQQISVHEAFRTYSPEELAAGSLSVVLRNPPI